MGFRTWWGDLPFFLFLLVVGHAKRRSFRNGKFVKSACWQDKPLSCLERLMIISRVLDSNSAPHMVIPLDQAQFYCSNKIQVRKEQWPQPPGIFFVIHVFLTYHGVAAPPPYYYPYSILELLALSLLLLRVGGSQQEIRSNNYIDIQ